MNRVIEKKASIIFPLNGVEYNVCTLIQKNNFGGFSYEFVPNYNVIGLIDKKQFCGIQGIDLDFKKDRYFRDEKNTFIYERVPPRNRVNLTEYLKNLSLDYYDPLEILLRKNTKYSGDPLRVVKYRERKESSLEEFKNLKKKEMIKKTISSIANGDSFKEKYSYKTIISKLNDYLFFYNEKIPKKSSNKVGRPNIEIDSSLIQVFDLYLSKDMSLNDCLELTGLSRRTFFRKLSNFKSGVKE